MMNDYYLLKQHQPLPKSGKILMTTEEELSSFFRQLFIIHEKNKSLRTRISRLYTKAIFKVKGLPFPEEVIVAWDGPKIWINDLSLQEFYRLNRLGLSIEDYLFSTYFEQNPEFEGYFTGKDYGI
jgi:hypothetical protein